MGQDLKANESTIKSVMELVNLFASEKKGSFFIISDKEIDDKYELLYPELFKGKHVNIKHPATRTLIIELSNLDGAIVLKRDGTIEAYGAKVKQTKVHFGHGTRHSAARGISQNEGITSIISSEEDGKVRVFENGEMIAEIDPDTGKNPRFIDRISEVLARKELQVATSGGVASIVLGLNPITAGLIFTGSWIITKLGLASIKDFTKTGKIKIKKQEE